MRRCYVSYMSNDRDIKGILVNKYLLNKYNSSYEYVCLCCDRVSNKVQNILNKNNIKIIYINFKDNLKLYNINNEIIDYLYNKHYYGKYFIFLLNDYDECIYLDTDILILKNIDELFLLCKNDNQNDNKLYMVNDLLENINNDILIINNNFNSGVIVFKPNNNIFTEIIKHLNLYNLEYIINNFHSDQTIFNNLHIKKIISINPINFKYNIMPSIIEFFIEKQIFEEKDIAIIHYTLDHKPWMDIYNRSIANKLDIKYIMEWLKLYNEYINYYLNNTLINNNNKIYNNIINIQK